MRRILEKLRRDPEGREIFGTHPGDLAVVFVAAVITACFVYLALAPQNWGAIDRAMSADPPKKAEAPQAHKGETEMIIYDHTQKK